MKQKNIFIALAIALVSSVLVAGCGGGGGGGGSGSGSSSSMVATPVDRFFADAQASAGSLNVAWLSATSSASGVPASYTMNAGVDTLTPTGTNRYSMVSVDKTLIGAEWKDITDPVTYYDLTDTGWVNTRNTIVSFVNNLNGTMTIEIEGVKIETAVRIMELAGTAINCYPLVISSINAVGESPVSPCTIAGRYPAGAVSYSFPNTPQIEDSYYLDAGNIAHPSVVTNDQGVPLTALPVLGTTFCISVGTTSSGFHAFKAITPAPVSGENYNAYLVKSCTQADIAATGSFTPHLRSSVLMRNTGNSVGTTVISMQYSGSSYLSILGVIEGKVYRGGMSPAGTTETSSSWKNKIAINAELVASGSIPLP